MYSSAPFRCGYEIKTIQNLEMKEFARLDAIEDIFLTVFWTGGTVLQHMVKTEQRTEFQLKFAT